MSDDLRQDNKKRLQKLQDLPIEIVTFEEIRTFIAWLYYHTKGKYDGVYGIPRAGLLLAVLYSYKADVPLLAAPQKGCLVIDDDIGSGLTLSAYDGKYDTAVMYSNVDCEIEPTYLYQYYDEKTYKVFAWNDKEDLRW